jgi:hypothetical protein
MKSTVKPSKAKSKVKPTPKPLATPVRPTHKGAVQIGAKPVVKPNIPPKGKPKVPAKPVDGKTTTKKPALIKKRKCQWKFIRYNVYLCAHEFLGLH